MCLDYMYKFILIGFDSWDIFIDFIIITYLKKHIQIPIPQS